MPGLFPPNSREYQEQQIYNLSVRRLREPMFENAGNQHSLLEDREACSLEMEQSPAAVAYRQNPPAYPDCVNQVFEDMNRCIERKGWKQVRAQQEQVREAITSELA